MPRIENIGVKTNLHNFRQHRYIHAQIHSYVHVWRLKELLTIAQNTYIVFLLHFLIIGVVLQLFKKMNSEYPLKIQAMTF